MLIFYPNNVPVSSKFFNHFLLALEKNISPQPARGSQKRTTGYYYEHWRDFSKAHEQNHDLTYEEWTKQTTKGVKMTTDEFYKHYLCLKLAREDAKAISEWNRYIGKQKDNIKFEKENGIDFSFSEGQIKYAQDEIDKIIKTSKEELKRLNL